MRHWSEGLVDEVDRKTGGIFDRRVLIDALAQAGHELDVMSGRNFHPARRSQSVFEPNGLPFVDIPDLMVGSMDPVEGAWAIPDPVNPQIATVLQVASVDDPAPMVAREAEALWVAGQILARVYQTGGLSRDFVLHWLGSVIPKPRMEIMRRVMDPAVRFTIPIVAFSHNGWWMQITRRLIWVTNETEDEGRLLEILMDDPAADGQRIPLVATEPILIVAPMTQQPVNWAFTARLWTEGVQRPTNQPWSKMAKAIHGHGTPTITLDPVSTPFEIACQLVLKGYWHGYIDKDEPTLAGSISMAYPQQVGSIQRGTGAPNRAAAAATLLEQLIRPGFNPAQGAEATRRYVRRKASIAVMEHRKREAPERYPWTQIGISERHYYKLLPLFAEKANGRYDYDHDDVVVRMKAHLNRKDREREVRERALEVLRAHGFSEAAARKWLQRHQPEEALTAYPRRPRP